MKNKILPFGIIAVLGVFAAIIVFYVGVNQKAEIHQADNGEESLEGEVELDGETIFANSCSSCHGADLSGGMGPDLTKIGNDLSAEEIAEIVINGQGDMPAISVSQEEADTIAEWLSEKE